MAGKRHNKKQIEKWKREYERFREINRQIEASAPDILRSSNFRRMKRYIQHGNMTVNDHVLSVARYSIALDDFLHAHSDRKALIRGALLHDYFLYDWHKPDKIHPHRLHGFYHPGVAWRNALKEYDLTEREKDIIKKHMWPLTVVPPMCREAWIVTTADKWCSLLETLHMHRGHGAYSRGDLTEENTRENNIGAFI